MFKKAQCVWIKEHLQTKNSHIILTANNVDIDGATLKISASNFYKLYLGDVFLGYGPARTAFGYSRVDVYDLTPFGKTVSDIRIEVAGYYCKALSTCQTQNFIVCEIAQNDTVSIATGSKNDFNYYINTRRLEKVERYSFQRHFSEILDYSFNPYDIKDKLDVIPSFYPNFLPRRVPYAYFGDVSLKNATAKGEFYFDESLPCKPERYSEIFGEYWGKYLPDEIAYKPFRWLQQQQLIHKDANLQFPITVNSGEYLSFDLKKIEVGFIKWDILVKKSTDVVIGFSEIVKDRDFDFQDANMHNVIEFFAPTDAIVKDESFEPYSARHLILLVKSGQIVLNGFGMRTLERVKDGIRQNDLVDKDLSGIFDAGVRTFVHNAVDLYTDCPSRERAGWLCDTYFTAKAEYFFFNDNLIEDAFLENYVLFNGDPFYPKGALPMCYPSDPQKEGKFIPQWCMWYVLEVYEYLTIRKPKFSKEFFKPSVYGVVDLMLKYLNDDGLLECLPSWNFVEWSKANWWTNDVNFPTQFLFSEVLDCTAKLYGDSKLFAIADNMRKKAIELSFDGEFFVDHAGRDNDGALTVLTDTSEAAQYYALLFGKIDFSDNKYDKFKDRVFNVGYDKVTDRDFVQVNAFIGFYLKQLALLKYKKYDLLEKEIKNFFAGQVQKTGTLWEYKTPVGSNDHGFASFAVISADIIDKLKNK
ncbi:MAG: hypothetical protein J6R83_01085 [Clostridia bacterium]|nr:hypothetical protein [Clostridia bacterium]